MSRKIFDPQLRFDIKGDRVISFTIAYVGKQPFLTVILFTYNEVHPVDDTTVFNARFVTHRCNLRSKVSDDIHFSFEVSALKMDGDSKSKKRVSIAG
ncbi:MAG: hypothetical protein GY786_19045 [Proteobacteria bacterium]|nr:hypothetical protein [Pseudomonadota bacterium]